MGARKGQNNFADHQKKVAQVGAIRMERALKALSRGRRYADVNALIRAAAEAADLHATTVRRNKRYMRAIWNYVVANPAVIIKPLDETAPSAALKVQAVAADIEAAALRRENERLRLMVQRLSATRLAVTDPVAAPAAERHGSTAAFERTATVLARVLARFTAKELGIVLDVRRGEILDEAEAGEARVIAGRPDTTAFLEWMDRQGGPPKRTGAE